MISGINLGHLVADLSIFKVQKRFRVGRLPPKKTHTFLLIWVQCQILGR
jgi:hypothetical protein